MKDQSKEFVDFELDGIDTKDYPDFADAFICSANVIENGVIRVASDFELDELNDDGDLVYDLILKRIY